ncbi:MAG: DUF362 domain-containing protein [Spirochaetes bacterium]|nr:DUF362 domain-containing protein [Spirochaetota bacterium]
MGKNTLHKKYFPDDASSPAVFIASGPDTYKNTSDVISKIDISAVNGKRVLLKPNAGRADAAGSGITTNPVVVAAAIDAFRDAGADVSIGESPITGVKAHDAFKLTGIADIAAERDCPLLNMDERQPVTVRIKDGVAIKSLKICPEIFEHDFIVSIPVMKTHMHTLVTLSVKNMKGCLWRRSKVDLHMLPSLKGTDIKPLDVAIADMASVLRPHLSILDGSTCMEGLGPRAGKPKKLDLVIAGVDPFAADAVACTLMGINPNDVPHLEIGNLRKYGVTDISQIKVSPDDWKNLISKFELPDENLSIHFPGITILDEQSCSACQSTLLLFLEKYGNELFDYFPGQGNITIAIGKGHSTVPKGTLCIGNCTANNRRKGVYVSGCPPVSSQIIKKISGKDID